MPTLKVTRAIFLSSHLALDAIITQFFAISFAQAGHFDLAAAVVLADSLLKLVLALPCAAIARRFSIETRINFCSYMRPLLAALWIGAVTTISTEASNAFAIALFVHFKLLSVTESAMSSDFQFLVRDTLKINLTQINSIQNIISRASLAISPALALAINKFNHDFSWSIGLIFAPIAIGSISLRFIKNRHAVNNESYPDHDQDHHNHTSTGKFHILKNRIMRWGLIYQLSVNFSFAGITYLLIVSMQLNPNPIINQLSALHALFFVYSIAISLFGDAVVPAGRLSHIVRIVMATAALSVLLATASMFAVSVALSAAMGLLYAYELAVVQKVLTIKLRGPHYIQYSALSKIAARAASAASVGALGACIGIGIRPTTLFLACGVAGLCSALALYVANPERKGISVVHG